MCLPFGPSKWTCPDCDALNDIGEDCEWCSYPYGALDEEYADFEDDDYFEENE